MTPENIDGGAPDGAPLGKTDAYVSETLEMRSGAVSRQSEGDQNPGWPTWPINFAGWAPTVSSRFTFSMLGDTRDPSSQSVNLQDSQHNRFIAHIQERETKDAARNTRARKRGKYTCFLAGVTHEAWHVRPSILDRIGLKHENGHDGQLAAGAEAHVPPAPTEAAEDLEAVKVERGMLTGTVCYFLKSADRIGERLRAAVRNDESSLNRVNLHKTLAKELRTKIGEFSDTPRVGGTIDRLDHRDFVADATAPIKNIIDTSGGRHGLTVCKFEFHRTGEVRIFVREESFPSQIKMIVYAEDIASLPDELRGRVKQKDGEQFLTVTNKELINENAPLIIRENLKRMIEPMFDFIRDTFHRHYHHTQDEDRMVDIFRTTPDEDHSWRLETLQKLMSAVQWRRRRSRESYLRDALGLLSYTEAFQIQLAGIKRRKSNYDCFLENEKLKPHYLRFLERSLQIEFEKRSSERSIRQHMQGLNATIVLAPIVGLLATLIAYDPSKVIDPNIVERVIMFAHENLLLTFITVLGLTAYFLFQSYDVLSANITDRSEGEGQDSPFSSMMSRISKQTERAVTVRMLSYRRRFKAPMWFARYSAAFLLIVLGLLLIAAAFFSIYTVFMDRLSIDDGGGGQNPAAVEESVEAGDSGEVADIDLNAASDPDLTEASTETETPEADGETVDPSEPNTTPDPSIENDSTVLPLNETE